MIARTSLLCRIAAHGLAGGAPGTPTNPDLDPASVTNNVIFKWTNTSPQGISNEVWISDIQTDGTQGAYSLLQTVSGNVSQISDGTIPVGVLRLYKIRSCSGGNCSAFTTEVAASNAYENVQVGAVNLPLVMSFNGILGFDNCTTVTLAKLRQCKTEWTSSVNANLTSLSLPSLQSVDNDFFIDSSPNLTSVLVPVLTSICAISGDLQAGNNTVLTTWNAPNLIFRDAMFIVFTGDALSAASINQILSRGVASGVTACNFQLAGGTNASPSGQGVVDKATLIGNGNTVNTN